MKLPADAAPRPPAWVVTVGLTGALFFALPFIGLIAKAPWGSASELIIASDVRTALWLSMKTSSATTVLAVVFGVPLAWVLARSQIPFRSGLRALCTLSMVLPPVVGGVALMLALGRRGIVGGMFYDAFGWSLPFTMAAVVVAQLFVAMPFLVLTVEAALRGLDPASEEAARTLGGSNWYVFRRITLPSIRPALATGIVLTWARAIGEFGATITFAGSFPGTTRTIPLATYVALETDQDRAIMLSLLLVLASLSVLVGMRERWVGAAFGGRA